MKNEGVEVVWVDAPISVDAKGELSVDIVVNSVRAPGVCNTRENTRVVCPDQILPLQASQKLMAFASLVKSESRVNAKHFIVFHDEKHAGRYLEELNTDDPTYTDNLVKKTNLFYIDLKQIEFKSVSTDYAITIVQADDKKSCTELSQFQQDNLPWFRRLTDEVTIKKTKDRYDLVAFNERIASPEVVIFSIKKSGKLVGTLTLNMHTVSGAPESASFGYLSDLFVAQGLENSADFISQLFKGVFAEIVKHYPAISVLSVMAAAGDLTIPIVKCFNHAKAAKLIYPFTRNDQQRLGIVAQFTLNDRNTGNTHLLHLPQGAVSRVSVKDTTLSDNKTPLTSNFNTLFNNHRATVMVGFGARLHSGSVPGFDSSRANTAYRRS